MLNFSSAPCLYMKDGGEISSEIAKFTVTTEKFTETWNIGVTSFYIFDIRTIKLEGRGWQIGLGLCCSATHEATRIFHFIANNCTRGFICYDGVRLNKDGTCILAGNFLDFINSIIFN